MPKTYQSLPVFIADRHLETESWLKLNIPTCLLFGLFWRLKIKCFVGGSVVVTAGMLEKKLFRVISICHCDVFLM